MAARRCVVILIHAYYPDITQTRHAHPIANVHTVTPPAAVATYLDGVAAEAADRPRAIAAAILARALRLPAGAQPTALAFAEAEVLRESSGDAELTAEIVYEIGSILVELRDRFPNAPLLDT